MSANELTLSSFLLHNLLATDALFKYAAIDL